MDAQRFDRLARLLATQGSRRHTLKAVLGGLFAARIAQSSADVRAAEDEGCCRCRGQMTCQVATSDQACETVCGKGKGIYDKYSTCENNKTCQPKPDADGGCCFCLNDRTKGCNNVLGKKTCLKYCGTEDEAEIDFNKKKICEVAGTGTKYTCHGKASGENAGGPVDLIAAVHAATQSTIDGAEATPGTLVVDLEQGIAAGYFTPEQGDQLRQFGWQGTYYSYWFVPKDGVPNGQAYSMSALWRLDIFADAGGAADYFQLSADTLRSQPNALDHSSFFSTGRSSHELLIGTAYTQADGTSTERESFIFQLDNLVASCQLDGIGVPLPPEDAASVAGALLEQLSKGTATYPVLGLLPIVNGAGPVSVTVTHLDGEEIPSYGLPPEYQAIRGKLAEGALSQVNTWYAINDGAIQFSAGLWDFEDSQGAIDKLDELDELLANFDLLNGVERKWDDEPLRQLAHAAVEAYWQSIYMWQPQPEMTLGGVEYGFRIGERLAALAAIFEVPTGTTLDTLLETLGDEAVSLPLGIMSAMLDGDMTSSPLDDYFGFGGYVDNVAIP